MRYSKTLDMVYISLFVSLTAVCAWISVPSAIPFTMQTFAVFAAAGLLGTRRSIIAIIIYILIGAAGIPVFSGFTGGFGILAGPTGGYILGFVFSAMATGLIIDRLGRSVSAMAFAMLVGLVICYAFGTVWFVLVYTSSTEPVGIFTALGWCVFPYIVPDIIKISLAILVTKRLEKHVLR